VQRSPGANIEPPGMKRALDLRPIQSALSQQRECMAAHVLGGVVNWQTFQVALIRHKYLSLTEQKIMN